MTAEVHHIDERRRRGRTREFDPNEIRALAAPPSNLKPSQIMRDLGCSKGTVMRALHGRDRQKTASKSPAGPGFRKHGAKLLRFDHPALNEKRTLFPTMVFDPKESVFKSGEHSAKIGGVVLKGAWKGFPVYTLTLEERATCPTICKHWASCFGNHSPFSRRFRHGPDLEWRIEREVAGLELSHPEGFVVRLHVLGDFYSWRYVDLWRTLLERHSALHCFGYTARIDVEKDIVAKTLALMVREWWPRFAIRFSNAPIDKCSTVSIEHPLQKPDDAIICPGQLSQTESCSNCALCWQSTKRVAFIQH